MNSADFGESMENIVREQRDIKLVTTEARRNYLVSEPNHHTAVKGMGKKKFRLSILEISKIVMCEFWCD